MPLAFECKSRLLKQVTLKPTEPRKPAAVSKAPGPNHYEPPQIFCGKGFSRIKRSPAYSFGHNTPISMSKPSTKPTAPIFDVRGIGRKGRERVPLGVLTPHIEPPSSNMKVPGPGAYAPRITASYKRPPAYSLRMPAKPTYQPWDMWTPPSNMYCPPIPAKRAPAYSISNPVKLLKSQVFPGPGEHEPNFKFVKKNKPAFSFGAPYRIKRLSPSPAPNAYCQKKFMVSMPTAPARSFGINHSPYIGTRDVFTKSSKLDLVVASEVS